VDLAEVIIIAPRHVKRAVKAVYSAPLVHLLFNGPCGTQSNC
jgi:hypothetical protein